MESVFSLLRQLAEWTVAFLGPEHAKALGLGLLLSHASTQFFKLLPPVLRLRDQVRDLAVRTWAVATAALPVFALWGVPSVESLIAAAAVGFASPGLYWLLVRACARWLPWVVPKMSGDPKHVDHEVQP